MDKYQIGGIVLLVMIALILLMTIVIAGLVGSMRMVVVPVRSVKSEEKSVGKLVL